MIIISPDLVISTPLAGCILPWLVSMGRGLVDVEFSPLTVTLREFNGDPGSAGMPPLPLIAKLFLAATSRLASQACWVVSPGSITLVGNSVVP